MRGHRYTEAEEILRKLVALHPGDAGAHMQLGRMLAADGQNEPAIAELQQALNLAPGDASVQLDLADLYVNAKKYDLAEHLYRSLLAVKPNDPELRYGLGRLLLQQRKFPEPSGNCWPHFSSSPAWVPHTAIWQRPPMKTRIMNW